MRAFPSAGNRTRSITSPRHRLCSSGQEEEAVGEDKASEPRLHDQGSGRKGELFKLTSRRPKTGVCARVEREFERSGSAAGSFEKGDPTLGCSLLAQAEVVLD